MAHRPNPRAEGETLLASLRLPAFRALWLSNLAATFAMQMAQVARGWVIYALTGSPVQLGWVMLSFLAPTLVLSLPAGVLADRVNKKRILVIAQGVNALSTVGLATVLATGEAALWHFLVFGVLNGSVLALSMPARQAMIPELVGEARIFNAMSLSSASMNLARVFGPAAAGALLAFLAGAQGDGASQESAAQVFLGIAALYAVASLGTLAVRYRPTPRAAPPRAVLEEITQGLSYVRGVPELRARMLTARWVLLLGMPMQFLMPAFNSDVLAAGPEGLGFLTSAMGGGAILGSLWVARLRTAQRTGSAMLASALLWALALLLFSLTTSLLTAAMAAALVGLGNALFMALNNGLIQTAVRPEMRGRVMSMVMLIWGGMPLGVLPLGVFAEAYGIAHALTLSALGLLLVLLWARWRLPSLRGEARGSGRANARAGAPPPEGSN